MKKLNLKTLTAALAVAVSVAMPVAAQEAKGASDPASRLSERCFSFKNRIENVYGFSFGFDYNALFQAASDSLGEDKAAGGVFRAYGQL